MTEHRALPAVKDLASSDSSLRRAAFNKITTHLRTRNTLTHDESLQLWRGLYVLLYMHDPRVPASTPKLIAEISSLVSTIPKAIRCEFCVGFWETMAREWGGIDRGRLDKYLSLVRAVLREEFSVIKFGDGVEIEKQISILSEWPLCADQRKVPDGLRYQVLDCWEDELEGSGLISDKQQEETGEVVEEDRSSARKLMLLVLELQQETPSKGVRIRAKEVLKEERLAGYLPKT